MAAKKKTKKKATKSKRTAGNSKKKLATKKETAKKKLAKSPKKKAAVKTKAAGKKAIRARKATAPKKQVRQERESVARVAFSRKESGPGSGRESGDLQGVSNVEGSDSESVEELLEEGNAFEAEVVTGVEQAGSDEREVRTHEVPEDDVPEEYQDKD